LPNKPSNLIGRKTWSGIAAEWKEERKEGEDQEQNPFPSKYKIKKKRTNLSLLPRLLISTRQVVNFFSPFSFFSVEAIIGLAIKNK